jgi:hypothetical protein
MHKTLIILFATVLLTSYSCRQTTQQKDEIINFSTAEEYNNYIIDLQLETIKSIQRFSDACAEGIPQQMKFTFEEFQIQTQNAIESLKKLGDYNGSTELRDEAMKLFEFYAEIAKYEYKQVLEILLKSDYSEQDDITVDSLIKVVSEKEDIMDNNFEKAQKKYAKENDLEMMKSPF